MFVERKQRREIVLCRHGEEDDASHSESFLILCSPVEQHEGKQQSQPWSWECSVWGDSSGDSRPPSQFYTKSLQPPPSWQSLTLDLSRSLGWLTWSERILVLRGIAEQVVGRGCFKGKKEKDMYFLITILIPGVKTPPHEKYHGVSAPLLLSRP